MKVEETWRALLIWGCWHWEQQTLLDSLQAFL